MRLQSGWIWVLQPVVVALQLDDMLAVCSRLPAGLSWPSHAGGALERPRDQSERIGRHSEEPGFAGRVEQRMHFEVSDTVQYAEQYVCSGEISLIESSQTGKPFAVSQIPVTEVVEQKKLDQVDIDLEVRHQKILGWGGAFTDAALININNLTEELSGKLMGSYFGENGLQYNFGRVPIGCSDFSTHPYSYDNSSGDYELSQWSLSKEDLELKIPYIKQAMKLLKQHELDDLKWIASPWSAPYWMKTNKTIARGHLIDDDKVYSSYANYLMKFYDAYEQHGIKFWGAK